MFRKSPSTTFGWLPQRGMRSLTHVQTVDVSSKHVSGISVVQTDDTAEYPTNWFQSVTGVKTYGADAISYGLVKSILNAIDPGTLKCLCLDIGPGPEDHPSL